MGTFNLIKSRVRYAKRGYLISAALLLTSLISLLATRTYVNHPVTGDEPHYLLMDYSLIHDGDLNLRNNFLNKDYLRYYPAYIDPTLQVGSGQVSNNSSHWYSIHGIGLPLILAPFVWLDGKDGAVFAMVIMSVVVIWLTYVWSKLITRSNKLGVISAASLLACYFFNGLAGYIYPDIPIAAMTLAALIIFEKHRTRHLYQFWIGGILGILVLLHFKSLAIAAPMIVAITYVLWKEKREIPWAVYFPFFVIISLFFLFTHRWFGVWNPSQIYPSTVNLGASPVHIVSALLFDSLRGLLIYNPILLVIFIGLPIWLARNKRSLLVTLFCLLPSIGLLSVFNQWQGGDAPTGRYVLDFLPAFMPAVGLTVQELKNSWQKAAIIVLFLLTLSVSAYYTLTKQPYVRNETRSPMFARLEERTGVPFDRLLPTFSNQTKILNPSSKISVVGGYFALLGLGIYGLSIVGKITKVQKSKQPRAY